MKQIISVRSNAYFSQTEDEGFEIRPMMELVIIHTNGKSYKVEQDLLKTKETIAEARLIVGPKMLTELITELQLHQSKMATMQHNADSINTLAKHIQTKDGHG